MVRRALSLSVCGLFFLIAPHKVGEKLLLYYDRVHQIISNGGSFS